MSSRDLRIFLVTHSLRQEDFAKLVGVSRQTVSNWCRDIYNIPQWIIDYCKDYEDDTYNKK